MAGTRTNWHVFGEDPPKRWKFEIISCTYQYNICTSLQLTWWQSSPTTGEASIFRRTNTKIGGRRWQTCRFNIIIKGQWTVQFENNNIIIQSNGIVFKSWVGIPNDWCNISNLWYKSYKQKISQVSIYQKSPVLHFLFEQNQLWWICRWQRIDGSNGQHTTKC